MACYGDSFTYFIVLRAGVESAANDITILEKKIVTDRH
jgi:hypothetical protein